MSIATVVSDDAALSAHPRAERASSKGFFLGLAISAIIWALLGIGTTISVSSSVVPQLAGAAISK